jgi:hypothetical protein
VRLQSARLATVIGVTPNTLAVSYRVNASRNSILFVCMVALLKYSSAFSQLHGTFRDCMNKEYLDEPKFVFARANKVLPDARFTAAQLNRARLTSSSR